MFGMKRTLTLTLLGAGVAAATTGAAPAKANPVPRTARKHPWGFLGLTKIRLICDEPIRPGSQGRAQNRPHYGQGGLVTKSG